MSPETTLADIEVRVRVFRDVLPHAGFHAACKALARIAQAHHQPLSAIPAADAFARYEALKDVPESVVSDERLYLRRALALPALPPDVSDRIRRGEPTFADASVVIDAHAAAFESVSKHDKAKTWRSEAGRLKGALKRLAMKLGKPPAAVSATIASVDAELARLTHADFAYDDTSGSFGTFCSRIRRAARLVDIRARRKLSASLLTGPWKGIVERAKQREDVRAYLAKLWPLVDHCERHDVGPEQVDDAVIAALLADLERHGRADAFDVARNAVYAWEHLQASVPGFPAQKLSRLYRDAPSPHAVQFKDLPAPFLASWEEYAATHFRDKEEAQIALEEFVLDEYADPTSLELPEALHNSGARKDFKTVITYAANVALDRGMTLHHIRDVLTLELMQAMLARVANRQKARADRQGEEFAQRSATRKNYATIFIAMARDLGIDEMTIKAMERLRDRIDPSLIKVERRHDGTTKRTRASHLMGPRHAKRLQQFNDPVKMLAWYAMFGKLEARVRARLKVHKRLRSNDCNDLAAAIMYGITRSMPVRPSNCAKLRSSGPKRNIILPAHHRAEGHIHIDKNEVKNAVDLEILLPPDVVRVIELWLEHGRPEAAKKAGSAPDNPYLFPGPGMTYRSPRELNKVFVARNRRHGGFVLNLHCQRHMAAKAVLDMDPSKMGLVQVLLGHKSIRNTEAYYAQINMIFAQRQFQQILAEHEAQLRALPLKRRAA
jgi:integrase